MTHDKVRRTEFSRAQLVRIRQTIELLIFCLGGIWIYQFGPIWPGRPVARGIFSVMITVGAFVICRVAVHTARAQFLAATTSPLMGPTTTKKKVYQVPRRFGILTIVFATLGIALLAALLHVLEVPKQVSMALLGLLAIVAFMQALMDKVPRSASVLAGMIYSIAIVICLTLTHPVPSGVVVFSLLSAAVGGALYGYMAGTFIAGLFMGAEAISRWWSEASQDERPEVAARQSPWD